MTYTIIMTIFPLILCLVGLVFVHWFFSEKAAVKVKEKSLSIEDKNYFNTEYAKISEMKRKSDALYQEAEDILKDPAKLLKERKISL